VGIYFPVLVCYSIYKKKEPSNKKGRYNVSRQRQTGRQSNNERDHSGAHHIVPRSRGGSDDPWNLYYWRERHREKHSAWHTLFANLLPSEAISVISCWKRKDGHLNLRYFRPSVNENGVSKRFQAWKILFNDCTPDQAIEWVRQEFIHKTWYRKRNAPQ
jgi:hypothetical protein